MKFPPLAELCNALIAAFNELRLCAPVQLIDPVSRKLELTLRACSGVSGSRLRNYQLYTLINFFSFDFCVDPFGFPAARERGLHVRRGARV